ncbi:hypothetical protein H634G_06385 [Metarhizium anisopliae BRIP 53293]|uniref:Uncharacterized protein n=1 Tax=Metarhizium anisopliae BRIP 53293 TaxID=1291518 RepID=A0A0D9NVZ6_METAN|nr:hypothetical protein H634G_06385 [Metarhizium anisopliae BRIP 53293]KJK89309.1 hypothetical protein H633G_06808 [Metarhizium anisopliae BRIP 53284]
MSSLKTQSIETRNASSVKVVNDAFNRIIASVNYTTHELASGSQLPKRQVSGFPPLQDASAIAKVLIDITTNIASLFIEALDVFNQSSILIAIGTVIGKALLGLLDVVGVIIRDVPGIQQAIQLIVGILKKVLAFN